MAAPPLWQLGACHAQPSRRAEKEAQDISPRPKATRLPSLTAYGQAPKGYPGSTKATVRQTQMLPTVQEGNLVSAPDERQKQNT
jgi:hypothetical protein